MRLYVSDELAGAGEEEDSDEEEEEEEEGEEVLDGDGNPMPKVGSGVAHLQLEPKLTALESQLTALAFSA